MAVLPGTLDLTVIFTVMETKLSVVCPRHYRRLSFTAVMVLLRLYGNQASIKSILLTLLEYVHYVRELVHTRNRLLIMKV